MKDWNAQPTQPDGVSTGMKEAGVTPRVLGIADTASDHCGFRVIVIVVWGVVDTTVMV